MNDAELEAADAAASSFGVDDLADVTTACDATTWLVIELLELDGSPVADEPYEVVLPGGEVRSGELDANGRAQFEGIDAGIAQVRFPARDRGDFAPMAHMPQRREALPWLEIELLDHDGRGVAGEPFVVELPDGSRRKGMLDEDGRARLEGLVEGECKVTFPQRHSSDIEVAETVAEPARA